VLTVTRRNIAATSIKAGLKTTAAIVTTVVIIEDPKKTNFPIVDVAFIVVSIKVNFIINNTKIYHILNITITLLNYFHP